MSPALLLSTGSSGCKCVVKHAYGTGGAGTAGTGAVAVGATPQHGQYGWLALQEYPPAVRPIGARGRRRAAEQNGGRMEGEDLAYEVGGTDSSRGSPNPLHQPGGPLFCMGAELRRLIGAVAVLYSVIKGGHFAPLFQGDPSSGF